MSALNSLLTTVSSKSVLSTMHNADCLPNTPYYFPTVLLHSVTEAPASSPLIYWTVNGPKDVSNARWDHLKSKVDFLKKVLNSFSTPQKSSRDFKYTTFRGNLHSHPVPRAHCMLK